MKYVEIISNFFRSLVRPYPKRDWYIVVVLGALLLLALIVIALYFFLGIRSGSIASSPNASLSPTPSVSRERLEEVVSIYETKLLNYQEQNIKTPSTPDPS